MEFNHNGNFAFLKTKHRTVIYRQRKLCLKMHIDKLRKILIWKFYFQAYVAYLANYLEN